MAKAKFVPPVLNTLSLRFKPLCLCANCTACVCSDQPVAMKFCSWHWFINHSCLRIRSLYLYITFCTHLRYFRAICGCVCTDWAGLNIGPSEVSALPLGVAAECSVHYFGDYFSFFSFPGRILFSQKGLS